MPDTVNAAASIQYCKLPGMPSRKISLKVFLLRYQCLFLCCIKLANILCRSSTAIIANASIVLVIKVARPAPLIPIAVIPQCPYIKSQQKKAFNGNESIDKIMAVFVNCSPSLKCLLAIKSIMGISE